MNIKRLLNILLFAALIIATTSFVFVKTQTFYRLYEQGERLFLAGKSHRAVPYLKGAYARKPEHSRAAWLLVWSYERIGKHIEAQKVLERMFAMGDKSDELVRHLADMYYSNDDFENAEFMYGKLLRDDANPETTKKYAEVLTWRKDYKKAMMVIEMMLKENPQDYALIELYADILSWSQKFKKAELEYRKLLAAGVHRKTVTLKLADILRYDGRNDEAVEVYTQFWLEDDDV